MGRCIPQPYASHDTRHEASHEASNDGFVIDYEAELSYWRTHYRLLPSCAHLRLEDVRPAIKVSLDACLRSRGRSLDEMWESMQTRYQRLRERSCLEWPQARALVEAVWNRLHDRDAGGRDGFDVAPALQHSRLHDSRLLGAPPRARQQLSLR